MKKRSTISKGWQVALVCYVLLVLTGCYSHKQIGFMQDLPNLPHYDTVSYHPYRLAVNDEIIYRLITMDETISKAMSQGGIVAGSNDVTSYRIYSDGMVDLPFLKPIRLLGLTLAEAQDTLQYHFREIIPDADVKLSLYNKTFTVLGDIGAGTYEIYKDKLTIFQALAMTGDVSTQGDRQHVRIIRPRGNAEPEILEFDLRTNTIIDSKYYWVYPNDVIYVSRASGSFYRVPNYSAFIGLVTSSVSLLVSVLTYTTLFD
ncbi:MAG: polysaccharide biosynthesis/export family protein [Paludibacteraceae bacterium]|nr:polysaccharide biosynthesis/export family protein [Paludibacteraceae bacterium]